jgi:hypothetical protein
MAKRGEAFHQLTALFERVFSGQEKSLRDVDTGQPRDFDIFLTIRVGHHTLTTAIECKDHTRPVDTPLIEAFDSKCGRNPINHRVFVASKDFTAPAKTKAAAAGIVCLELREVEAFPWVGDTVFVEFRREFGPLNIGFGFNEADGLPEGDFEIFAHNGERLTVENFFHSMQAALPLENDAISEPRPVRVLFQNVDHVVDATGIKRRVDQAIGETSYTVTKTEKPFTLHSYKGGDVNKEIASTEFEVGGQMLKLMMVRDDEYITVFAAPLKPKLKAE